MTDQPTAISIDALDLSLPQGQKLLNGITIDIRQGEILGLIGESGAGKSMVGVAIAGTLPEGLTISQGTIRFAGRDLTRMKPGQRRDLLGREIGFIPQEPMTALNPSLTIGQQIGRHLRRLGYNRKAERINTIKVCFIDADDSFAMKDAPVLVDAAYLAEDGDEIPVAGGSWTPASALGDLLLTRLSAHAGMTFELEPAATV